VELTRKEEHVKRKADPDARDTENGTSERSRNVGIDESDIDQVLPDSFPDSNAPPWTLGVMAPRTEKFRQGTRRRRDR
jgi:hypothetical protein